jgi:hypothetical protein
MRLLIPLKIVGKDKFFKGGISIIHTLDLDIGKGGISNSIMQWRINNGTDNQGY